MNKPTKFWDRVSSKSKPEPNHSASRVIELTEKHLNKNHVVMDFGCGSGVITNKLAKSTERIEAIDLSEGMINVAKKQAEDNSISNIKYAQASIFDERFEVGTFDVILSFNVLHYIEDMPELMGRINTLLKPGGLFISSTACLNEKFNAIRILMWLLNRLKIVPRTLFYKRVDLENHLADNKFSVLMSERISNLPEYYLIGKKAN